jgi:hypothetical protein
MCDGSGNCDFDAGVACTLGSECLSGHCTDGACCDSACLGSCQACDLPGSVGSCTLIASGTDPDDECAGGDCNGNGGCVLSGQSCLSSAECATGFCVDGVCCASACNGSCEACNLAGTIGVCSLVPAGQDPAAECGNGVCGGDGSCNANNGEPCAQGADCVSNFCVDDVCCNSPCTGTCQACTAALKGAGSDGSCGNIAAASDPQDECPGTSGCSGSGACTLLASGSPCSFAGECASNFCVDGVCCSSICAATARRAPPRSRARVPTVCAATSPAGSTRTTSAQGR